VVRDERLVGQLPLAIGDHRGRDVDVVEQRRVRREALLAHQLLVVEGAVGRAVLGVALRRDVPRRAVVGHLASLSLVE